MIVSSKSVDDVDTDAALGWWCRGLRALPPPCASSHPAISAQSPQTGTLDVFGRANQRAPELSYETHRSSTVRRGHHCLAGHKALSKRERVRPDCLQGTRRANSRRDPNAPAARHPNPSPLQSPRNRAAANCSFLLPGPLPDASVVGPGRHPPVDENPGDGVPLAFPSSHQRGAGSTAAMDGKTRPLCWPALATIPPVLLEILRSPRGVTPA